MFFFLLDWKLNALVVNLVSDWFLENILFSDYKSPKVQWEAPPIRRGA